MQLNVIIDVKLQEFPNSKSIGFFVEYTEF